MLKNTVIGKNDIDDVSNAMAGGEELVAKRGIPWAIYKSEIKGR